MSNRYRCLLASKQTAVSVWQLYVQSLTPDDGRKDRPKHVQCYLLTPWSRVLLEKLAGLQLVKKFPAFYGTRRFLTAHTSALHLSLSWARPIQSSYPNPTSWRSILILSSHLRLGLPSGSSPLVSPPAHATSNSRIKLFRMKDLWRRISARNESLYGCRDEKLGDANLWSRLQIL